jgi:hypothetical protein
MERQAGVRRQRGGAAAGLTFSTERKEDDICSTILSRQVPTATFGASNAENLLGNTWSSKINLAVGEEIPRRLEKTCKVYQKSRFDQKLREKL